MAEEQQRMKFSGSGVVTGGDAGAKKSTRFEVLAITAGVGNGWEFGEETLQDSLALWEKADCFIDHGGLWGERSVRDLAGVMNSPTWDAGKKGIKLTLKLVGPAAGIAAEIGMQLTAEEVRPTVGFSADVLFTAQGKKVEKILKVFSVDLVYNPARGGEFLRALNQKNLSADYAENAEGRKEEQEEFLGKKKEKNVMGEELSTGNPQLTVEEQIRTDQEAVRMLLDENARQAALRAEADKARAVRAEMCTYLLETALGASKLPLPMAEQVRGQFKGKVFDPVELSKAIEDARKLLSDLTASQSVIGPGRIHSMFDSKDKLQCATDDLLEAPRAAGMEALKVERLQGIRELYLMLTGDLDMHGGYHPDRVRLATTADFTGLVANSLNKLVVDQWGKIGRAGYDWWQKIVSVEHFSTLNTITGTLLGTVGTLPTVAEGAEYTELAVGDSPETGTFVKYGGYIPLTLELIDRDETRKLKAYARELGSAGIRKISALVAALFTTAAGAGPTLADGGALFNATAVTSSNGHANYLTTALTAAQWEVCARAVYAQPMLIRNALGYYGTGPKMAVDPAFCLVPRALAKTARDIFENDWDVTATIHASNLYKGKSQVLVVPEWTEVDWWSVACDPAIAPAIFVGERFGMLPEIFIAGDELSPAVFMNDEHRLKVRHFLAVWVNDFRPLANNVV